MKVPPAAGARGPRAFTLIELMVVVAIIGVLSALAAPNITKRIERVRAEGEARRLIQVLVGIRNEAWLRRACVKVTINTTTHTLSAVVNSNCTPGGVTAYTGTTVSFNQKLLQLVSVLKGSDGTSLSDFHFSATGGVLGAVGTSTTASPSEIGKVLFSYTVSGAGRTAHIYPATGLVKVR